MCVAVCLCKITVTCFSHSNIAFMFIVFNNFEIVLYCIRYVIVCVCTLIACACLTCCIIRLISYMCAFKLIICTVCALEGQTRCGRGLQVWVGIGWPC